MPADEVSDLKCGKNKGIGSFDLFESVGFGTVGGVKGFSSWREFIFRKVHIKSFCKSQFPHRSVNVFFTFVIKEDKLTDLCEN